MKTIMDPIERGRKGSLFFPATISLESQGFGKQQVVKFHRSGLFSYLFRTTKSVPVTDIKSIEVFKKKAKFRTLYHIELTIQNEDRQTEQHLLKGFSKAQSTIIRSNIEFAISDWISKVQEEEENRRRKEESERLAEQVTQQIIEKLERNQEG